jgi:hypothetical protein
MEGVRRHPFLLPALAGIVLGATISAVYALDRRANGPWTRPWTWAWVVDDHTIGLRYRHGMCERLDGVDIAPGRNRSLIVTIRVRSSSACAAAQRSKDMTIDLGYPFRPASFVDGANGSKRRAGPKPRTRFVADRSDLDFDGDGVKDYVKTETDDVDLARLVWRSDAGAEGAVPLPAWTHGALRVFAIADVNGDGRDEVLVVTGGTDSLVGGVLAFNEGGWQVPESPDPGDPDLGLRFLKWHAPSDTGRTADVACKPVAGTPSIVVTESNVEREWHRTVYRLQGSRLVVAISDGGRMQVSGQPPWEVPLSNRIDCGTARP